MKILIVDDEKAGRDTLKEFIEELGHHVLTAENGQKAFEMCHREWFPLVITDIRMPVMDGIELLKRINAQSVKTHVIICTGHGDMQTAISALREGAFDYLNKPINVEELVMLIERSAKLHALENENQALTSQFKQKVNEATTTIRAELERTRNELSSLNLSQSMIFEDPAMQQIYRDCLMYHRDPAIPVLIEGETGTGKEIIAKLIHYGPSGNMLPYVDINCSALSKELVEAELFGYEAGAFTGGKPKGERGKLDLSGDGTLFLDEIGDMPIALQPKLLRVLQDRTYYPVGGLRKKEFCARIISATNRRLEESIEAKKFRRDLYYRLAVGRISIPPLRERPSEILIFAEYFMQQQIKKKKKRHISLSQSARDALTQYSWPGNVRELENTVERLVLAVDASTITSSDLWFLGANRIERKEPQKQGLVLHESDFTLPDTKLDIEKLTTEIVRKALEKFSGNKSKAAAYLGISRNALYSRIKKI